MKTTVIAELRTIRIFPFMMLILAATACTQEYSSELDKKKNESTSLSQVHLEVLDHFLFLADLAAEALRQEPAASRVTLSKPRIRKYYQFFVDSYAVRALAVAYDLTGRERYFAACRTWSDRMLRHQSTMIPPGAYYMNYHRKPGESTGQWFVADCGSIAMGIVATAARCTDETERKRYMDSARSFARLVTENFVRESGGITDGHWKKSDKEWWCSTALFSAFAFQLYGMTGNEIYKKVAIDAVDWLLRFEYNGTILYKFEQGAPTTIFYILEAYASGLPYFEPGSKRQQKVFERLSQTVEWITDTQTPEGTWDYNPDNWGVKLGGLPCHLLIYLKHVQEKSFRQREWLSPSGEFVSFENLVTRAAEKALHYFATKGPDGKAFTQKNAFTMMSYAEKLCPDELYHKTSVKFPYKKYSEQELSQLLKERQHP
jgi:hypothetical protein